MSSETSLQVTEAWAPGGDKALLRGRLPDGWIRVHERRFRRRDGAVVRWDDHSPHPNPLNPRSRMWTAWEPDPSESYLRMTRGGRGYGFPRRWGNPFAAMRAVNREYPLPPVKA